MKPKDPTWNFYTLLEDDEKISARCKALSESELHAGQLVKTMEQVFTNKEHGSSMMKSLSQLWKNKRYCDAVLEIGSEKLEFHKLILVACSPFVLGTQGSGSDSRNLILKLKGEEEDVEAAKACLQYMYEGVVQLTESNVDSIVEIARLLHVEDLVMFCSSFQDLLKNMKKFKQASSIDVSERTNKRYELVIENEIISNSGDVVQIASKDTPDSTREDNSAVEISTEPPDSGDDSHSDFEQNIQTSNRGESISGSITDSTLTVAGGNKESFTIKMEPDFDSSDAQNEDNEMFDENSDSDCSYTPKIKRKKKSPKATKTSQMKRNKKKGEAELFTVVKNEEKDCSVNEAEWKDMDIGDLKRGKGDDEDITPETLDDSIDLDGFIEPAEGTSKYKYLFKCPMCKSRFIRKDSFLKHLQSHTDPQVTCSFCSEKFDSCDKLEAHKKSHLTHLCNQCGAAFSLIKRLNEHLSYVHGSGNYKTFTCEVEGCGKIFPRRASLESHMNFHEGLKPHVCTKCGRGFANLYSCRRHESDCRDARTIACEKCGELFKTKGTLYEHKVTVHQKNKTFTCTCGKKFSWRSGLARHKSKCGKELEPFSFDDIE